MHHGREGHRARRRDLAAHGADAERNRGQRAGVFAKDDWPGARPGLDARIVHASRLLTRIPFMKSSQPLVMKSIRSVPILACAALLTHATVVSAADAEKGFNPIFNGKDLSGWNGDAQLWSVKEGVITGQTTVEHPAKGNTFLIWTNGTVGDFEIRCSFKIAPNNDKGFANSGIQYRSKVLDEKNWVAGGYQADMEAGPTYTGILYDERGVAGGRNVMAARGEKVVWDKDCQKQV